MTKYQENECHKIIHTATAACSSVALVSAQLPCADNAVIVPIQIGMIISLGGVFGKQIDESYAKSIFGAEIATVTGRGISQALAGWIPVIGNVVNATTAAGVTEILGWAVANDFFANCTIESYA